MPPILKRVLIGLLLLACLGVGELWLYAAHRLGDYMHAPVFGGKALADYCETSDIGGFPFRLRMTCPGFSAPLRTAEGDILAKADEAKGTASIFSPGHIVLTLTSPIALLKPDGGPLAKLRHDGMTLDVAWAPGGLDKAKLDIAALDWRPEAPQAGIAFNLREFSALGAPAPDGALHFEMTGAGLSAPLVQQWLQKTDLGGFTARGRIAPQPRLTGDFRGAIEAWRKQSGALTIEDFDWRAGDLRVRGAGVLSLDDSHRALGRLDLAATGAAPILSRLGLPVSAGQIGQVIGALFGKPANGASPGDEIRLPLTLADGHAALGPILLPIPLQPLY